MKPVSLLTKECKTVNYVSGPLIFVQSVKGVSYGEIARITLPNGDVRTGQVLDISRDLAVIQVFEGTSGIDNKETRVQFTGEPPTIDVSIDLLGRILNGVGKPRDGGPDIIPEASLDINGMPINPYARDKPADFIQTGMSTIDALTTLVRGQKLPIFSGSGLPANKLCRPDRATGKRYAGKERTLRWSLSPWGSRIKKHRSLWMILKGPVPLNAWSFS